MPSFSGHSILHSEASHNLCDTNIDAVYSVRKCSARKSFLIIIIIICERFFISFSFASLAWYHNFHMSYGFCYLFELQKQKFCIADGRCLDDQQPHRQISCDFYSIIGSHVEYQGYYYPSPLKFGTAGVKTPFFIRNSHGFGLFKITPRAIHSGGWLSSIAWEHVNHGDLSISHFWVSYSTVRIAQQIVLKQTLNWHE